ncbi:MAG: hypothetical protein K6G01_00190 [Eubacterium sp.]|nr:hypothetical protein [Eubacterium sp.]
MRVKKQIIRFIAFGLIFIALFFVSSACLRVSDLITVANMKSFYKEPENTLDVVFIGASEVYADYCATTAWDKYGYTSMSLGASGVPGSLYKSMLRETLSKQNPKLVVFEINGFTATNEYYARTQRLHSWIDYIENPDNKEQTIKEAIPKDQRDEFKESYAVNHNNWKLFHRGVATAYTRVRMSLEKQSYLKGYATKTSMSDDGYCTKEKTLHFTKKSRKYMTELLEYCKSQGVEQVLFARFPHQRQIKNPDVFKQMEKLVTSYGYDFVNFEDQRENLKLVSGENYYNPEHLNVLGSAKFTNYLGQYLVDHYDIKGQHSQEVVENWDKCADKAKGFIKDIKIDTKKKKGYYRNELTS